MRPKPSGNIDYEQVKTEDFIAGVIEKIERDENHKTNYMGQESFRDCVRFKFKLDGYQYAHCSRWLTFSYSEKANLYKKFILPLVDNAYPDIPFDIEKLEGMKVKTLWGETKAGDKTFQFIETIRPLSGKIVLDSNQKVDTVNDEITAFEEDIPQPDFDNM